MESFFRSTTLQCNFENDVCEAVLRSELVGDILLIVV